MSLLLLLKPQAALAFEGTLGLSGSGGLSAAGSPGPTQVLNLSGSGSVGAAGSPEATQTLGLSGSGSVGAAGSPEMTRTLALSGAGTLRADPQISNLKDSFTLGFNSLWDDIGAGVSGAPIAVLSTSSADDGYITSNEGYDFNLGEAAVSIVQFPDLVLTATWVEVGMEFNGTVNSAHLKIAVWQDSSDVYLNVEWSNASGGTAGSDSVQLLSTSEASNIRVRDNGGTVYFETSSDGNTWDVQRSVAMSLVSSPMNVRVYTLSDSNDQAETQVDNFNSIPEQHVGTLTLSGSGTQSRAGAPAHTGTLALSGSGTLTSSATPAHGGSLALSGSGSLVNTHGINNPILEQVVTQTSTSSATNAIVLTTTADIPVGRLVVIGYTRSTSTGNTSGIASVAVSAGATDGWVTAALACRSVTFDTSMVVAKVTTLIPSGSTITPTTTNNSSTRRAAVLAVFSEVLSKTKETFSYATTGGLGETSVGSNGSSTTQTSTATGANTTADVIQIGVHSTGALATNGLTPTGGSTLVGQAATSAGSSDRGVSLQFKVLRATSTATSTGTNQTSGSWAAGVATFPINALPVTYDYTGSLSLSGSGTIAGTGTPGHTGTVALAGSGTISPVGTPAHTSTVALSGSGTLSGTGVAGQVETGSVTLSGSGSLTRAGSPGFVKSLARTGSGTLTFMAETSIVNLVDTFTTTFNPAWSTRSAGVSIVSDQASIPADGTYKEISTSTRYTIVNTSVSMEITQFPSIGDGHGAVVGLTFNGLTQISIQVESSDGTYTTAGVRLRASYYADPLDNITNYYSLTSTADARWVRIRESGGTYYWDISSDGVTWVNKQSSSFVLSGMVAGVYTTADASTPQTALIDNFNIQPAAYTGFTGWGVSI